MTPPTCHAAACAAIALSLAAQSAGAQGQEAGNWSGFYGGAALSFGTAEGGGLDSGSSGLGAGLHGGYAAQFGDYVLGGEVDFLITEIEDAGGSDLTIDSLARVKLRAGWDAGPLLPYVTAGIAQATTSGPVEDTGTGNFAGLGLDYQLTDDLILGGEVIRHEFDDLGGSAVDATTLSARVSFRF